MDNLINYATILIAAIGVLAFVISIITQVFKGVSFLKKIPTDIMVFFLSIGLTLITFLAVMQFYCEPITWYMIIAVVIVGFIVAFVSMYGWEKAAALWKRFSKNSIEEVADDEEKLENGGMTDE